MNNPVFDQYRLFLARTRAACRIHPQYHRHQLAALDHELALVEESPSPEAHLRAGRHVLEPARAALLDRAANDVATALEYDDPWSAAAAGIEYVHVLEAASHDHLLQQIYIAKDKAQPLRTQSAEVFGAFARLFHSLLHIHTSRFETGEALAEIPHALSTIRRNDPAFQPRSWLDQNRYRLRLPWTSEVIHDWLAPWFERGEDAPAPDLPADPTPAIRDAFGRWRSTLRPAPHPWPELLPLPCPERHSLLAHAESQLVRETEWCDPVIARHWTSLIETIEPARTTTALYAISTNFEKRLDIETAWNSQFLTALLSPLRAIATSGWSKSPEDLGAVPIALQTVGQLTGIVPADLLSIPAIDFFLRYNLQPRLNAPRGLQDFGAFAGESGFDLVKHTLAWRELGGDLSDVRRAFEAVLTQNSQPAASPERIPLQHWGRSFHPSQSSS